MSETKNRKDEHIKICLEEDVQFRKKTACFDDVGFGGIDLRYKSLPETSKSEISLETEFLGKTFSAPLMVSGMTGGTEKGENINRDIAKACQELGIGMGLGSQRAMLENRELSHTYKVRDVAPDIFLAGNIGVLQLGEYSVEDLEWMLEKVGADALAIHINAAQEAVQKDGGSDFKGGVEKIRKVAGALGKPVYVKEVGHGISMEVAKLLSATEIKAIDVGGAGGTSWVGVESFRGNKEKGELFWDIGIPTPVSILKVRKVFNGKIIASGGIRSGLDVVKSLILGADIGEIALPVLKAQDTAGSKGVKEYLEEKIEEIRTSMFLAGANDVKELKEKKVVLGPKIEEWLGRE